MLKKVSKLFITNQTSNKNFQFAYLFYKKTFQFKIEKYDKILKLIVNKDFYNLNKINNNQKKIIGISAYYHDSAAALLIGGEIISAVQEERFTRKKYDSNFPFNAIKFCLNNNNLTLDDIDTVIYYEKPLLTFERLLETYLGAAPRGVRSFIAAMQVWLKEKLFLKSQIKKNLRDIQKQISERSDSDLPQLLFSEHHLSHAASAFYPSPFNDAAILCMDGVGEWATTSAWKGKGSKLNLYGKLTFLIHWVFYILLSLIIVVLK